MVFVEYKNASRQQRQQSRQQRSRVDSDESAPFHQQLTQPDQTQALWRRYMYMCTWKIKVPVLCLKMSVYHYFTARAKYTAPPTPLVLASKANSRFATRILSQLSSSRTWSPCCLRTCSMVLIGLASLQTLPMFITSDNAEHLVINSNSVQICTMYTHNSVLNCINIHVCTANC